MHDNARPYTAAHTVEMLRKLKFEVMAHPPYSPDLAPSDYHLFDPLKVALRGRRFTSDQEVMEAVHVWLAAQLKTYFRGASGSLYNNGPSALKSKGTVLKHDVNVSICIPIKCITTLRIIIDLLSYLVQLVLLHICSLHYMFRQHTGIFR